MSRRPLEWMVMCRLLGYATAGLNRSLEDVLGGQAVKDFHAMSVVHNDGWGTASLRTPEEPPYRRDGGAPYLKPALACTRPLRRHCMTRCLKISPSSRLAARCGISASPARICR